MTSDTPEQQPRILGVRYRRIRRERQETVTIDGTPEIRTVPYDVWVPAPPHDWDRIIARAVVTAAVAVTALAVSGTTASIGGLLTTLVPVVIAYCVAVVFDASWLVCIAVEWLERHDPDRARAARNAGWGALLISMAATVTFGHHLNETAAGAVGGAVSLLAKGLWWLVLRYYAVPLSDAVAFWLRRRREKVSAKIALSAQIRRLNQHEAYVAAAFGPDAARAAALASGGPDALPTLGNQPDTAVPTGHIEAEGSTTQPVVDPDRRGTGRVKNPAKPPVSDVPGHDTDSSGQDQAPDAEEDEDIRSIAAPTIAQTMRAVLKEKPKISDFDLLNEVVAVHGEPRSVDRLRTLAETVRRTRSRIEGRAS